MPVACLYVSLAGVFADVNWTSTWMECLPHVVWPCCLGHYCIYCTFGLPVLFPPADPEDLLCFRASAGLSQQPQLLWFSYSVQHVLFITCCHGLSEAAVTNVAFLFMEWPCWRHTSNHHHHPVPSALRKICFVGIIQRRGVSFAKLM